jgi:hypothetical protein
MLINILFATNFGILKTFSHRVSVSKPVPREPYVYSVFFLIPIIQEGRPKFADFRESRGARRRKI